MSRFAAIAAGEMLRFRDIRGLPPPQVIACTRALGFLRVNWPGRQIGMDAKPRLLDRVRDRLRTLHYSRRTEQQHVFWMKHCTRA